MLWSINTENHKWYQSTNILHSRRINHNWCFIDQFELRSFSSAGIIMNNSSLCAWFIFMNNNDPSYWLMSQTHKAIKDKHPSPVGASLAARKRQRYWSFSCFLKYPWKIHRQSRSSLWGHKSTPVLFLTKKHEHSISFQNKGPVLSCPRDSVNYVGSFPHIWNTLSQ